MIEELKIEKKRIECQLAYINQEIYDWNVKNSKYKKGDVVFVK